MNQKAVNVVLCGLKIASVLYSPQGAIFLRGNKVTEHPISGDEGGKFLFEVIPGRMRLRQFNHSCFYRGQNGESNLYLAAEGTKT